MNIQSKYDVGQEVYTYYLDDEANLQPFHFMTIPVDSIQLVDGKIIYHLRFGEIINVIRTEDAISENLEDIASYCDRINNESEQEDMSR